MDLYTVQEIASLHQDSIPAEFVMSEKEQPIITTYNGPSTPEIPTIDLNQPDQENLIRSIVEASQEWGIFQVVNHGIPAELIKKLQDAGKEFFELPQQEKELYAKPPDAKSLEGYGTKLQKDPDGKKSWNDHLFHKVWPPSCINYKFWPKNPPSYIEVNEEYTRYVKEVADKLFTILSLGLGLEGNALKEGGGGQEIEYMQKINYYPPCPRPDLTLGVVAHTDLSALTILVPNEVPGLQVFKDDCWMDVKHIPNGLIIHIGDQIEILSNGKYKSVLHRTTVSKEKARMSWPVFLEPPGDWAVGPLPQLINEANPPKYKAKKFTEYMHCKLNKLPQ